MLMNANAQKVVLRKGLISCGFSPGELRYPTFNERVPTAMLLMQGVQPTAEYVYNNWSQYSGSSVNCLSGIDYSHKGNPAVVDTNYPSPSFTTHLGLHTSSSIPNLLCIALCPTDIECVRTGTCTWAIISQEFNYDLATRNQPPPSFLVVPVSDPTGSAPVRLSTISLVQGTSFNLYDFGIIAP